MTDRVSATPAAIALIEQLTAQHGPIVFFQSGGCCEGSGPMCLPAAEFKASPADVKLGELPGGAIFYMSDSHFSFMHSTHTILDAMPGSSGSFSLDCGSGMAFITRGRLYSDEELANLQPEQRIGFQ
ncbi:DUF779 domain-containing protein [Methylophilus methylotrophus]|uniref:DUF779 domain-containing protein n=1 Tax=Methylophilus methylotrophus TaxID=17 RepID=UPI000382DAD6|nr:DUF779 domain-containing protein [Methylophilus methylotrophus]